MRNTQYRAAAQAAFLLLIISGLCQAQNKPVETGKPSAAVTSGPTAVLAFSMGGFFAPKGARAWTPAPADLAHLEADLAKLAKDTPIPNSVGKPSAPKSILVYYRQYLGYTQSGRHYIYVNAFCPSAASDFAKWRQQPAIVSDGGSCFYNVVYDVKSRRFGSLRFNGYA